MSNILLIDHYDSFTYNLVDELLCLGHHVETIYSTCSLSEIENKLDEKQIDLILLSPGYGRPEDAKTSLELVVKLYNTIPILGICLGFQIIVHAFSGSIKKQKKPVHGKRSIVKAQKHSIFEGISMEFYVARYHSLAAKKLPKELNCLASCADDTVMALSTNNNSIIAFQFHPESLLSENGSILLENAIRELTRFKNVS